MVPASSAFMDIICQTINVRLFPFCVQPTTSLQESVMTVYQATSSSKISVSSLLSLMRIAYDMREDSAPNVGKDFM